MNAFSKIVSIILCVIAFFLLPIYYNAQKQDQITQSYVSTETANLVNEIRNSGILTADMYEEFIAKIDATNNLYDINITHAHLTVNPDYKELSGGYTDETVSYYANTYTDTILDTLYNQNLPYYFTKGDYVSFKVVNKTKTYATKLQEMIFANAGATEQIIVTYGGAIRDETH